MLPRKQRVRTAAFTDLVTKSALTSSPFFSLRSVSLKEDKISECAVVVSKKVAAAATDRNKIRRRCYHALRDLSPKIKKSYRMVLFVKKGAEKLPFTQLSEEIRLILSKARVISGQ